MAQRVGEQALTGQRLVGVWARSDGNRNVHGGMVGGVQAVFGQVYVDVVVPWRGLSGRVRCKD